MKSLYKSTKAWLSFTTGKNPVIEKPRKDYRKFIPDPYEGIVIISADFELAWAWRFADNKSKKGFHFLETAKRERKNISLILDICENSSIPITWGTVGHLFLKSCEKSGENIHGEIKRLPYFKNRYWDYSTGDWFDHDPNSDYLSSPEWYAPDLIDLIINSSVNHEIACHSFSHIACNDNICRPEVLKSELEASQKAADQFGIRLESFIFPGHTMGNFKSLRDAGYSSIRTNFINVLGYPKYHPSGLWEYKSTMELVYNQLFSVPNNLTRFRVIIDRSIRNHQVCCLWFHPSFNDINIETILPGVFNILNSNRNKLWITTMREYTNWLNTRKNEIN